MKNCPHDNKILTQNKEESVLSYYSCNQCYGIWIPKLAIDNSMKGLSLLDVPEFKESLSSKSIECLDGHGKLKVLVYQDVEIDICEDCSGIWLDHGEYGKIKRYFRDYVEFDKNKGFSKIEVDREIKPTGILIGADIFLGILMILG